MSTQQPDALQCAADLEYSISHHRKQDAFTLNAYGAMKMVLTQHASITELESQLAQRFDAADVATASAQGFRDGVASVSAGSESVAAAARLALETLYRTHQSLARQLDLIAERAPGNFLDKRPVVNTLNMHRKRTETSAAALRSALDTHPSPPEGMAAEQALLKVLAAVQRYLPPDGPSAHDTLTEIIEVVDPWPLGQLDKS